MGENVAVTSLTLYSRLRSHSDHPIRVDISRRRLLHRGAVLSFLPLACPVDGRFTHLERLGNLLHRLVRRDHREVLGRAPEGIRSAPFPPTSLRRRQPSHSP